MRVVKRLTILWFLLAVVPFPLGAAEKEAPAPERAPRASSEADYVIGPGDILNIDVWKDSTLTRLVTVLPDGKIAFPMVGEMMAAGKTSSQLKTEVENRLSLFLKDAVITVEVRQVNSLQIYVLGRVKNPGRMMLSSNIDVLQALAAAGGPDQFAKLSRIRIFRREGGTTLIIPFDYDDVIAGKNMKMNILLRRGDIIIVP